MMTKEKFILKEFLTSKLHVIMTELHADFSAIAFYDPINLEFRWRLAVGSLNNRYTSIVVRSGKGIAGRTLKTKREFIITNFPEELQDEAIEFPILIVEELKSAVAVPLLQQHQQMIGVLLIGQRSCRKFEPFEIERIKVVAEEMLSAYIHERNEERKNSEEKKEKQKSILSRYFIDEKIKRGNKIEIILLDQRVTLLSEEIQHTFVSIFEFLFDCASKAEFDSKIRVIIERKSEQQFAIQIDSGMNVDIAQNNFSQLADKVRKLNGSIEVTYYNEKTILTMNFFLNLLLNDQLWENA